MELVTSPFRLPERLPASDLPAQHIDIDRGQESHPVFGPLRERFLRNT
jgi:hypothetical protein